ncbi:MAG: hypothetical protein GY758_07310 [Fuerstiella sp.]|jgi:hypothetical protein|nr:hypothetical protein [Fuerstiella sp.]MCP4505858.1 hypothetical protein [Fuerstiella sp.]
MSLRFCLAAWTTVIAVTACSQRADAASFEVTPDWRMEITPARKAVPFDAAPDGAATLKVDAADYVRIYRSIPFNRAEYNVNPNYRHDSTMEILTGIGRHQTIVRHGTPKQVHSPASPYAGTGIPGIYPDAFIRPGVRLNYYRHFPSLNPYWSIGNPNGVF